MPLRRLIALPLVGDTSEYQPTPMRPVRGKRAREMHPDTHFEPHEHAWAQIAYCVSGTLQVSVQDVRYGEAVTKKYTEAQAAEIDKQKALNEQQVAKTEAETKKIKARGEADANAVLNESLTDNVLKQHYIDALSNADQLVVVPDGADTLVQTK